MPGGTPGYGPSTGVRVVDEGHMKRITRTAARLVERFARPVEGSRFTALKDLVILGYHRIDESGSDLSVRPDHFRAHLEWIERRGLSVVSLEDPDLLTPSDTPRVALTFDDGYRSVAERAWPELRARRWPATAYVVPGYLDGGIAFPWDTTAEERSIRVMDRSIVRELVEDGMAVGSHTVTHRYLPGLPPAEARTEVSRSKEMLEDLIQRTVTSFSYPMGGWNRQLRSYVAEAGYVTAVTCRRGRNGAGQDPLTLRRPIVESDPLDFQRIMKGYFDFLRPLDWWREEVRQRRVRPRHGSASAPRCEP